MGWPAWENSDVIDLTDAGKTLSGRDALLGNIGFHFTALVSCRCRQEVVWPVDGSSRPSILAQAVRFLLLPVVTA